MMQLFYLVYEQDRGRGTRENVGCMLSCWSDGHTEEWRGVTSDSRIRHKWQHLRIFPRRNCTTFYEKWQFCLNNLPPPQVGGEASSTYWQNCLSFYGTRLGIDLERVDVGMVFFFSFCGRWKKVKWSQQSIQVRTGHIDTLTMESSLMGEPKP